MGQEQKQQRAGIPGIGSGPLGWGDAEEVGVDMRAEVAPES